MKIAAVELLTDSVPLTRPYAIANATTDEVSMVRVSLRIDEGAAGPGGDPIVGLGAATPEPRVTGETFAMCVDALRTAAAELPGRTFTTTQHLDSLLRNRMPACPGARAALDMALHDARGKANGRAVADLLGRVHESLPTSITIGVRNVADTLAEAREYLGRGFRVLKVKVGESVDLDVERLQRLRELVGAGVPLLADANLGYTAASLRTFLDRTRDVDVQLVEQPLPPDAIDAQRSLPPHDVARFVADESLHTAADAERLARAPRAFSVFNIKLMKCGGITEAMRIADVAKRANLGLMWGCMDESVIGIAAALHAAFASAATRWLDLDGSFDLSRDFGRGGFELRDGMLRTTGRPGLGVDANDVDSRP